MQNFGFVPIQHAIDRSPAEIRSACDRPVSACPALDAMDVPPQRGPTANRDPTATIQPRGTNPNELPRSITEEIGRCKGKRRGTKGPFNCGFRIADCGLKSQRHEGRRGGTHPRALATASPRSAGGLGLSGGGGGDTMKNRVWGWKASLGDEKRWRDRRNRNRLRVSFASGRKRSAARWTRPFDRPKFCRSAFRLSYAPYQPVFNVGFRVVCEAAPEGAALTANTSP